MAKFFKGQKSWNERDWEKIDAVISVRYPMEGSRIASDLGITVNTLYSRASKIGVKNLKRIPPSEETKRNISQKNTGRCKTQEWRRNLSISLKGKPHSARRIESIVAGVIAHRRERKKMTSPEAWMQECLFNLFGRGYSDTVFSGNGKNMIAVKNKGKIRFPDFVCHSQRKVIEVFGRYWHRNDNANDITDWYQDAGWECLIVWDDEISISAVDRVYEFLYPYEYEEELRYSNAA